MVQLDKHNDYMRMFYNRVSGNEVESYKQIPLESMMFLSTMTYEELTKPFIKEDLLKGKSIRHCELKYRMSRAVIRRIGYNCGVLTPKRSY